MTKLKALLFVSLILNCTLTAQLEFSKWFINNGTGLNFATNPPTALGGFSLGVSEGCASIADAQGNLLFYSNGVTVNDASHNAMANGSGLIGHPSTTQAALIVKQPGSSNIYYLFTMDEANANNQGAYYSIIDMTLAAGMGSVTSKNNFLFSQNLEKQIAIRHCNGKDVWILCHEGNNSNFRAYLLTANGLNTTPVISSTGNVFGAIGFAAGGEMKASPDGKKIGYATASAGPGTAQSPSGFYTYDFDASTGTVSNQLYLITTDLAYGVEFSPDGTKLYGTKRDIYATSTSTLCQWDICQTSTSSIISSLYTTTVNAKLGAIQRAIDDKLYLVNFGTYSLSVINNPNNSGSAMNLAVNSTTVGNFCAFGLPNYVTGYTKPQNAQISSSVTCQKVMFNAPSYTSATGCTNLPFPVNGYLWSFGDAPSGTANTSTLSSTTHDFSSLGTYTVSLVVYTGCENDTIKKIINITTPSPSIAVSGTFTICKGDKRIYSATGGNAYVWNNTTASATLALSPTQTTSYTVAGTSSLGCTGTKQFTVTVSPCVDLSMENPESRINIWPNPFTAILKMETNEATQIEVLDLRGVVVMEFKTKSGLNEFDTSQLPVGFYIVRASNNTTTKQTRLVKVE